MMRGGRVPGAQLAPQVLTKVLGVTCQVLPASSSSSHETLCCFLTVDPETEEHGAWRL